MLRYVSLGDSSGYGLAAVAYLHGLHRAGVDLGWTPLFPGVGGYAPEASADAALRRLRGGPLPPEAADLYDAVLRIGDGDVCVLHTVPELWARHRQARGRHVGYTVWELTHLPPHWPPLVAPVDLLLTPSRFSADAFLNSGVTTPIAVVPHVYREPTPGADGGRFRARHGIPAAHTLFYTINAWTARKALWRTLHAYCAAFTAADETTLVVKTSAQGPAHENDRRQHPVHAIVHEMLASYPDAPRVCLITADLSQAAVDDLHAAGDCFVSLPHAEGWGLGAFEAAGAGRPVVMTAWGGQLDFLAADDALLVDYTLVPVRSGVARSYRPDQQWALADLDHAIARLQWVHAHRADAAALGARAGVRVRQAFASATVVAGLQEQLGV